MSSADAAASLKAPKRHNIRGDSNLSTEDDDISDDAHLGEGMNFFDSFQESVPENDSNSNECMLNDAVSQALVGESVVDSPSQHRRDRKVPTISVKKKPQALQHAVPSPPSSECEAPGAGSSSVGIVAQGFAWLRGQREERRRRYLQEQVEEQARKIELEANLSKSASGSSSESRKLVDNPTFRTLSSDRSFRENNLPETSANYVGSNTISNSSVNADEDGEAAQVSYSGDGYTVEFSVTEDVRAEDMDWVPPVRIEDEEDIISSPYLLNEEQRQTVARQVLPKGIAYAKWKRLYSLARDGDSFEACLRLVKGHAQTLMVVQTSKDEILGGFADMEWESPTSSGAVYHGGPTSCLFSFVDVEDSKLSFSKCCSPPESLQGIRVYKWTGANRYIQLCDAQRKMLAFGGGGDDGAFGLSVAQDFQHGSSGSCATFDNQPLASSESFIICDLEIYCFLLGQF